MTCPACAIGATMECFKPNGVRCNKQAEVKIVSKGKIRSAPVAKQDRRGAPIKGDNDVTDPKSTGRKRAAILLPLKTEDGKPVICEWMGLKYAGGGQNPIIGCSGNPATNRHHGPDKNTLNNSRETPRNIHAICPHCHNRWHALNDPTYIAHLEEIGGPEKLRPHDMETKATVEEIVQNEARWRFGKKDKESTV